jgi:rubrerythrin
MSLNRIKKLLKINEDTSQDERNIRKLLSEEYNAVADYEQFATEAQHDSVRRVLLDIAGEERIHIGELEALLDEIGMATWDEYEQGSREIQDIIYGQTDGNIITGEEVIKENLNIKKMDLYNVSSKYNLPVQTIENILKDLGVNINVIR